jgi:hypothetical protein
LLNPPRVHETDDSRETEISPWQDRQGRSSDLFEPPGRVLCGSLAIKVGCEEWGEIFGDDVMAALIDRLVHHCHIVTMRGNSYRVRQHTDLWHALHTTQDPEPASNRRRRARLEAATN